ncbi:MAG: 3-oxoacyl-ACP synthase III family protein [Bacteroidia bacterium]
MNILIKGTGSYIPNNIIRNDYFKSNSFFSPDGTQITETNEMITKKLERITGINERRYIDETQQMYEIAEIASLRAINDAGIDAETLDGIILAHNFGTIAYGTGQVDLIPSIASKVKHALRIKKPDCIAFDIVFGCPGWLQGVILARQHILTENTKRILVIGAETLSRVVDPHDRDSMIYADGSGAVILEASDCDEQRGIISTLSKTYSYEEAYYIYLDRSNKKDHDKNEKYLKMRGRKIYEFALKNVPQAMKQCLDKSGIDIQNLKKIFIHQANEKMDEAILNCFYKLYNMTPPDNIMPMNIHKLGNSSVATIPTLLDTVLKNVNREHKLEKGDAIMMASVGAGMNVNSLVYIM